MALSLDARDCLLSGKGSKAKIRGKVQKQKYEARVHRPSARQAGAIQGGRAILRPNQSVCLQKSNAGGPDTRARDADGTDGTRIAYSRGYFYA